MGRRFLLFSLFCAACLALAPSALAAKPVFRPRIKNALGLAPPYGNKVAFSPLQTNQPLTPETYHGGQTMTGGAVTIHTIFWTGGTHPFQGKPPGAPHNYIGMIQQFVSDAAKASTGTNAAAGTCTASKCNVFTNLLQYGFGTTPGGITKGQYTIDYNASTDSFVDTNAYPAKSQQCASPHNTAVCITDAQLQAEINNEITKVGGSRGLNNIWYVFLPPGVDECISPGACGTTAFAGYHSLSNISHTNGGLTIYALSIDPIIESRPTQGSDPQGYPDAERTINVVAHEVDEAMTDPEGVGYMDPNGFEVGDKCENGPQLGTILGFAGPDNAPFNQVINGHKYLLQTMWANRDNSDNPDCVQATTNKTNPLPLPQVTLNQFSSTVSGNTENNANGVTVKVTLERASASGSPVTVATGSATTTGGAWSVSLAPHAVGDDRDVIVVDYSGSGAPTPSSEQILTGNGGNPFTESGWTGWVDMANGSILTNKQTIQGVAPPSLSLGPCFQTGVEAFTVGGTAGSESPTDFCNTTTDFATAPLSSAVTPGQALTWSSLDDRAFTPPSDPNPNLTGALVNLTVNVGEPDSVSLFSNPLPGFTPGGFPTCTGDLEAAAVTCAGLVPGQTYTLHDGSMSASGNADGTGTVSVPLAIKRGNMVALSNGSRTLTTLHVANLRADINGNQTVLSGGQCQPGEYYGPPVTTAPTNASAGSIAGGIALTGEICPLNGSAAGLPSSTIAQTDERSGGQTQTEVPLITLTSPADGQAVTGKFIALARAGFPGPNGTTIPNAAPIALTITHGGTTVFSAKNVDTTGGVTVSNLKAGVYQATWTLTDANGDTRTLVTQFTTS